MVKLILLGRGPGLISSLNSHLPAAFFFFGSPKGMPPKKKKNCSSRSAL
jgi:hypothetical protein